MKKGSKQTEESINKIKAKRASQIIFHSKETREKISKKLMGHSVSKETREKNGLAHTGKPMHPNTKIALLNSFSPRATGVKMPQSHVDKSRERMIGNMHAQKYTDPLLRTYSKNGKEKAAGRPKPELCEVCNGGGRICFDHDHETGQFRGWICSPCNSALGFVRDSVHHLDKLINYLNNSRNLEIKSLISINDLVEADNQ